MTRLAILRRRGRYWRRIPHARRVRILVVRLHGPWHLATSLRIPLALLSLAAGVFVAAVAWLLNDAQRALLLVPALIVYTLVATAALSAFLTAHRWVRVVGGLTGSRRRTYRLLTRARSELERQRSVNRAEESDTHARQRQLIANQATEIGELQYGVDYWRNKYRQATGQDDPADPSPAQVDAGALAAERDYWKAQHDQLAADYDAYRATTRRPDR